MSKTLKTADTIELLISDVLDFHIDGAAETRDSSHERSRTFLLSIINNRR